MTVQSTHTPAFRHEALMYASREDFLAGTLEFVRAGLDAGEPTLVVLNRDKLDMLRSALGSPSDGVCWADMTEVGGNPARIIPAWRDFVDEHGGRRVRGIGEPIWPSRSPAEIVECQRHESLLNLAFADADGFHLLCPYDTESLDDAVLDEACRSHPHLTYGDLTSESVAYRGPEQISAPFADPLPEPRTTPLVQVFQKPTLSALRRRVARYARETGFGAAASEDLALGVTEVATNSVVHGGGAGLMRLWEEDGSLICEISDGGSIDDPLAGRHAPGDGQLGGFGLWLANQVCDLVQVRSFPGGSTVRLHKRRV